MNSTAIQRIPYSGAELPAAPEVELADDVITAFAAAARAWPHRAAITHNGEAISYQQLAERVYAIALRFQARRHSPAGRAGLIGVLVSHRPTVVENLLGILRAGATYCPIDAALPAARQAVLASTIGLHELPAETPDRGGPTALRIETHSGHLVAVRTDLRQPSWRCGDPAYVLCTSGSTGVPKPVVVSRHALAVTVRALRILFELVPDDRVLQFAALGWDTCLEEMLPALTAGAAVVFDDDAHTGSFPRFLRMLARRGVTVLDLPTAFWHELVLFLHEEQTVLPDSVRLVVIGGERVDPTRLRQWRDLDIGNIRLLNTYGCTETTMVTHAVTLSGPGAEPQETARETEVPIGRALPHVREHLTAEGELLVAGASLATGYLGLIDATATGFPVADHGAGLERWFRTGDVVSRDHHGLLYPLGRVDEQVKVLGVRVHPAEVEAQLNTHPEVAGSVVVGERRSGRTALSAYVVATGSTTSAELRQYLRDRLPKQFVPTEVKFVAALEYTATGKVDREATRRASAGDDSKGAGR